MALTLHCGDVRAHCNSHTNHSPGCFIIICHTNSIEILLCPWNDILESIENNGVGNGPQLETESLLEQKKHRSTPLKTELVP